MDLYYRVKAAAWRKDSHVREHSRELHLNVVPEGFSETMDGESNEQHLLSAEQGENLGRRTLYSRRAPCGTL